MNTDEFINITKQFSSDFFLHYCVVNGSIMKLDEVQAMGLNEFNYRSKISVPLKLYRYFPNQEKNDSHGVTVNYSLQALVNNTVYLQSPTEYDDVYDSDITIDLQEYSKLRLIEYCSRCGIDVTVDMQTQEIGNALIAVLWERLNQNKSIDGAFTKIPDSELEDLANKLFCNRILVELTKTNNLSTAIANALACEYSEYSSRLKALFRTTCFATTPFSQLMWGGAYADCHRGFCLEYTVLPYESEYRDLFFNLFPMIYCKVRPNMTERITAAKDKILTTDDLWDIYFHGALRKSIDWAFQNEWRLLLPLKKEDPADYNLKFYPISKVFLGNRMPADKRKVIIDICKEKGIPYIGVKRNPTVFEMQECEVLCENCPQYMVNT